MPTKTLPKRANNIKPARRSPKPSLSSSLFLNLPKRPNKLTAVLFILIFAGIGSYLLLQSKAATLTFEKGVVADITWGTTSADVDRTIAQLQDAGVKWVRTNIAWTAGEANGKGQFNSGNFAQYDYAISKARNAGINVLMPVADGVPCWASGDPAKNCSTGTWNKRYKPANYQDYTDFFVYVVNRYKTMDVHTFEVWNEPNLAYFWPSGVDATEYLKMLKSAYPAIKAADPTSTVLMGGLSKGDYNYLQQLYTAGGGAYFDVANVHPYSGSVDPTACWNQAGTTKKALDAFCSIEEVRSTMVANGDSAKDLWLTEFGWSTCLCSYGVSEAQQADYLTKAFTKLESYPYVKKAFWYNFRNAYWGNNNPAVWNDNTGLMRVDYSQKPAYAAYKAYGAGIAQPDTTQPSVPTNLTSPSQTTTSINLSWTASTDNIGVTGYDVYRNNTKVGTVATNTYNDTGLTASITYSYYVIARDAAGNSSPPSNTINATTPASTPPVSDITAPVVNISRPINGSSIGRSTAISATASDNVAVTKMEVYTDGVLRTTTATGSISYTWNTKNIARGAHTITVKAYDATGNAGQSSITVYK